MIILSNTLSAIAYILHSLLLVYFWVVVVATLLTWVRPDPYNPIVRTLSALTQPIFYRIQRLMPFVVQRGIDFTPIVLLLSIELVDRILIRSLAQSAQALLH